MWLKSIFLLVLVILEHREIDDPAEAERALLDEVELLGDAGAREAGEPGRFGFLAGGEEDAVVGAKAHRLGERVHALGAVVLGDRAAPFAALAGRIAESGEAFASRPFVHVVEEFAALFGGAGRRDRAHHPPPSTILANSPKPEPRKRSPTSWISSGLRRSGLSVPYFSSASL